MYFNDRLSKVVQKTFCSSSQRRRVFMTPSSHSSRRFWSLPIVLQLPPEQEKHFEINYHLNNMDLTMAVASDELAQIHKSRISI